MKQILLGKAPLGNLQAGAVVGAAAFAAGPYVLFNDTFTTDRAAGAIDGTLAEPGPGIRYIGADTNGALSLSSGSAVVANTAAGARDPSLFYNGIARNPGRILLAQVTSPPSNGNGARIGWGYSNSGATTIDTAIRFAGATNIGTQEGGSAGPNVANFATGTTYQVAVVLRAAGMAMLIKGGVFTSWTLLWIGNTGSGNPVYPGFQTVGATPGFSLPYIKVPAVRWLPAPLVSDGFGSWGESDGLGHAEGVAGGYGGGGDGITWTGSGWSATDGKASNTPIVGSDLATDGGLEAWNSATDLTNWTEQIAGSSTINLEASDVHGGTAAARFDIDSSNSVAKISQTISNSIGDWLLVRLWAKSSVNGKIIQVDENSGSNQGPALTLTTTYQQFVTLIRATKANTDIGIKRSAGGSSSIYIDDIEIKVATITSLLASAPAADDDVMVTASVERVAGSLAGLLIALDSAATPANFIVVFLDGTGYVRVAKVVAGVYTPLASTAVTYVAGAKLRASKRGSALRVFYNGALVGSELTISDVGIVNNTRHGLISTDASNAFDNFTVYASGTAGDYDSVLDAL